MENELPNIIPSTDEVRGDLTIKRPEKKEPVTFLYERAEYKYKFDEKKEDFEEDENGELIPVELPKLQDGVEVKTDNAHYRILTKKLSFPFKFLIIPAKREKVKKIMLGVFMDLATAAVKENGVDIINAEILKIKNDPNQKKRLEKLNAELQEKDSLVGASVQQSFTTKLIEDLSIAKEVLSVLYDIPLVINDGEFDYSLVEASLLPALLDLLNADNLMTEIIDSLPKAKQ